MEFQAKLYLISVLIVGLIFTTLIAVSVFHYVNFRKRTRKEQAIRDARAREIRETRKEG